MNTNDDFYGTIQPHWKHRIFNVAGPTTHLKRACFKQGDKDSQKRQGHTPPHRSSTVVVHRDRDKGDYTLNGPDSTVPKWSGGATKFGSGTSLADQILVRCSPDRQCVILLRPHSHRLVQFIY
jgi:hypothetical protein